MTRRGFYLAFCLAIACASAFAQDQQSAPPPAPSSEPSQQNEPPQNPPAQNQSPQNQPQQNPPEQSQSPQAQPPQNQTPQVQLPENQPPQSQPAQEGQKKEDTANPSKENKSDIQQAADATRKFGQITLNKVVDWESGWLTGPYVGRDRPMVAMTGQQRRRIYLQQTLTAPGDYFKRMFSAAVDQARNSPLQWGQGWAAYGERFGSREGQFVTANSLAALGDAALKYEPRYDQCKCSGFRLRTRHAILRNFVTYDQSEQQLRPQWALYGGAFGGGLMLTAWKPHPRNPLVEGAIGMVGQAGYGALLNFFVEFAGDINRKLGAKTR